MLAHLARLLVKDGRRVFVTALTHRAIHNALDKIPRMDDSIPVCKIGEGRHAGDLDVPNFERFDQSRFGENSGGYVIGATPFARHSRRLSGVEFDVVLFDEASQITLPLAIMGMLAGSKYIFIGDENQLPPVTVFSASDGKDRKPASIFGYLSGRGYETMLDVTYRLNDVLTQWPSRTFYRNELKPSAGAARRRLNLSPEATRWDMVLDPEAPAVFLDLCHQNTTVRRRIEADVVMELILSLLMRDVSPEDIGVEVVVPAEMTVRPPIERRMQAGLTDYLLDYDQEAAVKSDLELPADDQVLPGDLRLNIINGVAGSGKTLILSYRLRILYHLYPNKKFLVLTHNRPLNRDMEGRFARLEGCSPKSIEWRTFNGWCYHHWPKEQKWIEPLKLSARRKVIEEIWRGHLQNSKISPHMFQSEVDWMKDQVPLSRAEYLSADRRGRGFPLNAEQRQRVFDTSQAYQLSLEKRGAVDWGDVPKLLWQLSENGQVEFPKYDIILVDEAQFFAPLWMRLIQKLLDLRNGHLFLVADPTQGFLGRGASWKSLGLDARGHIHSLRHSYRTTREIMQFATLLYRLRLTEEKDEDILVPDLLNMPNGAFPQIITLTSPQDEIARVANEVINLVKQGFPRKHLLLLHRDGWGVKNLIQAIDDRLGKNEALDPKDNYPGDYVRVTTINAGAGLESPIVFLVGLRLLFEEEQSLRLSDEEREGLIRDNTRKLYMAATRAGQRLVLTYSGELPKVLKSALELKTSL